MTRLLSAYYQIRKMAVKIHQQVTHGFVISGKSVPQGDALNPLMYSLAVAPLICRIDKYVTSRPSYLYLCNLIWTM